MKRKKLKKRLGLNKQTVANLINTEMEDVNGGATYTCGEYCNTMLTCRRFCCETFLCPTDPQTDYCYSVQFCTE